MDGSIVKEIYQSVYHKIYENRITVFLCGGTNGKKHYRDRLGDYLNNGKTNISVLYPEDLFIEILNKKQKNLVYLEQELAENSDVIILLCESPGAFAELGSFVMNTELLKKLIVLVHSKHKNDRSYIMYGPANLVKANKESSLIFYNSDFGKLQNEVDNAIKKYRGSGYARRDIDTIVGMFDFVVLLLYFYDYAESKEIITEIRDLSKTLGTDTEKIKIQYTIVRRWLFKEKLIEKKMVNEKAMVTLTQSGYEYAKNLTRLAQKYIGEHDINGIRMRIMKDQYCRHLAT